MDSRSLEVINQIVTLIIYGIVFSREIIHKSFDLPNTIVTVGGIIFSVAFMFFIWYFKSQKIIE